MTSKKNKILVAEDDKFISEIYFAKLSSENFDVSLVMDGQEALDELKKEELPDLLLLDILMPQKGGIEVLEELRSQDKYKDLPIIVLTNASERDYISKAMDAGATDYLVKSNFTPDEVVDKIKEVLSEK